MQIEQTSAEGLRYVFSVHVPKEEIGSAVDSRLGEIRRTLKIPGFRPGKVPLSVVRQRYGQSVMGEVLEEVVDQSSGKAIEDKGLRPAMQPKIEVTSFEPEGDLKYTLTVEVLPEIEPADLSKIALTRLVAEPDDEAVDKMLDGLAERAGDWQPIPRKRKARKGDQAIIDFAGTVDGEAREGMQGEDVPLELGSGAFIPGFEDQVIGLKPEEEAEFPITFPEDYGAEDLAGKEAVFKVTLKALKIRQKPEMDDEFAKTFGRDSMEELRQAVRDQLKSDYGQMSRLRIKRGLLDALAERHDFPVPQGMVDVEFDSIWKGVEEEKNAGRLGPEDEGKSDDELKAEYRAIAERRVRLGLLLTEIGRRANLQIAEDELRRALVLEASRYPGQEKEVMDYFRKTPQAVEQLKAPIYEDKVVDYILEIATVTDETVTPEELAKAAEEA